MATASVWEWALLMADSTVLHLVPQSATRSVLATAMDLATRLEMLLENSSAQPKATGSAMATGSDLAMKMALP